MSIIKYVTLQKIVARDFWYDPRIMGLVNKPKLSCYMPLALANDRQLEHFTVVIPTERPAERSVGQIYS